MTPIHIISHRGGQTDNQPSRDDPATRKRPAENTVAAIEHALGEGANGVEIDVVRTGDNRLAVIHSANLKAHVFSQSSQEPGSIGAYTLQELQSRFRVGPRGDGVIPELHDVLTMMRDYQDKTAAPLLCNIEIKDVKGAGTAMAPEHDVTELLAATLANSPLPLEQVIVSSFSIEDIRQMAAKETGVRLGFLFDVQTMPEHPVYPNQQHVTYRHATPENIREILETLPGLSFLHPPLADVNETVVQIAKESGLGINSWALDEVHPASDARQIERVVQWAVAYEVPLGMITNFVPEMQELVTAILNRLSRC